MAGNDFLEEVLVYSPFDNDEEQHKTHLIELLQNAKQPFSREELGGHVTGSAMVVNQDMSKTFMILHKKLKIWLQPGGHCDGNPIPYETAQREIVEETGFTDFLIHPEIFDIDVHPIPEITKNGVSEPAHFHHDVRYLVIVNENHQIALQEEEIDDGRWFTLEEAEKINPYRPFTRMIDKLRSSKA